MRYTYSRNNSFMNRLDPASKGVWLICMSLIAIFLDNAVVQISVAITVLFVNLFLAQIPADRFWRSIRYFFIFCTSYFFMQSILTPGELVLWRWKSVTVTWEGIEVATASALAIFTIIMASLAFVVTTNPKEFAFVLHKRMRVPYVVSYMLFVGLRFLPLVEEVLENIKEAQMVRGVGGQDGGLRARIERAKQYTVPLLATTFQRGRVTAWAMDSKGFRILPDRTYLQSVAIEPVGKAIIAGSLIAAVVALIGPLIGMQPPTLYQLLT